MFVLERAENRSSQNTTLKEMRNVSISKEALSLRFGLLGTSVELPKITMEGNTIHVCFSRSHYAVFKIETSNRFHEISIFSQDSFVLSFS